MFRGLMDLCLIFAAVDPTSAADNMLNPLNVFDITLAGKTFGSAFDADQVNKYYVAQFDTKVGGVWTTAGSNGMYVTAAGVKSLNVSLANQPWAPGTSYPGRVCLMPSGITVDTKTGTFRN
jgi:hypothetical protein